MKFNYCGLIVQGTQKRPDSRGEQERRLEGGGGYGLI